MMQITEKLLYNVLYNSALKLDCSDPKLALEKASKMTTLVEPKWSKFDKTIAEDTTKLLNQLLQKKSFSAGKIELFIDSAEKPPLKTILSAFPFSRSESCKAGDLWFTIDQKLFSVWERKTKIDLSGSIGSRSDMQKYKLQQLPVERRRVYYLMEEVSDEQYEGAKKFMKPNATLIGAEMNLITRDGFGLLHSHSLLNTVLLVLKQIVKMEEHFKVYQALLTRQPLCIPSLFKPKEVVGNGEEFADPYFWVNSLQNRQVVSLNANENVAVEPLEIGANAGTKRGQPDSLNALNSQEKQYLNSYNKSNKSPKNFQKVDNANTLYIQQLMLIPSVSREKALKIATVYPTLLSLLEALKNNRKETVTTISNLKLVCKTQKAKTTDKELTNGEPLTEEKQEDKTPKEMRLGKLSETIAAMLLPLQV